MPKLGPIGIPELLIILLVVLLIFGPRRLPDMAKGLGQSVREFRKGLRDMRRHPSWRRSQRNVPRPAWFDGIVLQLRLVKEHAGDFRPR